MIPLQDSIESPKEVSLPLYYRESFFANDSLLHPELPGGQLGVAGDLVPYTLRGDDIITALLLFCFVMAMVVFAHSRQHITRQLKDFFYIPRHDFYIYPSSSFQLFLCIQTCLLLAIFVVFYISHYASDTFVLDRPYGIIAIYFGLFLAYFSVKVMAYSAVNNVFFGSKKNKQWIGIFTFITSLEGVALFPAVMLQIYFNLPLQSVVYYLIFTLVLTKILTFYKAWIIFFKQIGVYMQIILYLCALEIIPLLAIVGTVVLITDHLKVIF